MMNGLCPKKLSRATSNWLTVKCLMPNGSIPEVVDNDEYSPNKTEVPYMEELDSGDPKKRNMHSTAPDNDGAKKSLQVKPHPEVKNSWKTKNDVEPNKLMEELDCGDPKKRNMHSTAPDNDGAKKRLQVKPHPEVKNSWKTKAVSGGKRNDQVDSDVKFLYDVIQLFLLLLELLIAAVKPGKWFVFAIIFGLFFGLGNAPLPRDCNEGQLYSSGTCTDCPPGTYMDKRSHQYVGCFTCAKATPSEHTVVKENCTPKSNTVLKCEDGYNDTGQDPHSLMCDRVRGHNEQVTKMPKISYGWSPEPDSRVTQMPKRSYGWSPEPDSRVSAFVAAFVTLLVPILIVFISCFNC